MQSFGRKLVITLTGGSHEPFVGVVLRGVPAGISLCPDDFRSDIDRRRPRGSAGTARREADEPIIDGLSPSDFTTGEDVSIVFRNEDIIDSDYSSFESVPRPGHADRTSLLKYGHCFPGGGIFSGRMTLPIVAAGVVAKKMLPSCSFESGIVELGGSSDPCEWDAMLERSRAEGDSLGGIVECRVSGVPAGLGEPFFDPVESVVSHLVFSIPGVRGIEFGHGFRAAAMSGSEHNDAFGPDGLPLTGGAGGVNGGISNGGPLVFRVAFKPASSIAREQRTFDFSSGKMTTLSVRGRHDVCFALRCPVVVEAAAALALADLLLLYNNQ